MHGNWALGAGVGLWLWVSSASAEVTVDWQAPAGCLSQQEVERRIEVQLGSSLSQHPVDAHYRAVALDRGEEGWQLQLELAERDRSFTRRLEAESCDSLAEAAAVAIALTLQPLDAAPSDAAKQAAPAKVTTGRSGSDSEDVAQPTRAEVPSGDFVVGVPADSPITEEAEGSIALRAGVGADLFTLPEATWVAEIALQWSPVSGRSLRPALLVVPEQDLEFSGQARMTARMVAGVLDGCLSSDLGAIALEYCLGAEVGSLWAAGASLERDRESRAVWAGARLSVGVRRALSSELAIDLSATAVTPLARHELRINGRDDVHTLPPLTARAELGLVGILW